MSAPLASGLHRPGHYNTRSVVTSRDQETDTDDGDGDTQTESHSHLRLCQPEAEERNKINKWYNAMVRTTKEAWNCSIPETLLE